MTASNREQLEHDARWQDEGYSAEHAGYTPHFLAFMRRWTQIDGGNQAALDVGCGDGFFSREMCARGYRVTGLDLSDVALARARQQGGGTFLAHDTSQRFPFSDQTFALVWCSEHLEHLFSPLSTLEEIRRVLRPGGKFLATVPYHGLVKNVGIALFAFDRHYDPTYPHIRFFTKNTLGALATRAGLDVISTTTCGSGFGLRDMVVPTNILLCATRR